MKMSFCKHSIVLFLLLCQPIVALSQENVHNDYDTVYPVVSSLFNTHAELGGTPFSWLAIHAEGTVFRFDEVQGEIGLHHSVRVSVGATVIPFSGYYVPVNVKYLMLDSDHHIEIGVGAAFLVANIDTSSSDAPTTPPSSIVLNVNCGYRYEPRRGGFQFRIGFSPYYEVATGEFWRGFRVSIGRAF
ncbi:MAG TPA: hypothetical protein VK147_05820 [Candidatus Didemnitutus sp.]|nr:hypothetical protein [Candidatus Didemnitutus sp.]